MTIQVTQTDSIVADDFFTGSKPVGTGEITVKVGQNIAAREVLALESTTGKYVTYTEGGADGTGLAVAISAYAIDATAAEMKAQAYNAGEFNPDLLVFSGTPSDIQKAGLFVGSPISLQTPQA
jgi:hypothetical protein